MGLFDFISKEARDKRTFDRNAGKVLRKTRAKDERMDEPIHFLAALGTDEALFVLLKRYDVSIQSESMDRFEKELIHDLLVEQGHRAIPPIVKYLQTSDAVTWPIQALRKITTGEQVVGIDSAFERHALGRALGDVRLQRLKPRGVGGDVGVVDPAFPQHGVQQAVEQHHVGAGLQRQVEVGQLGGVA